MFVSQVAQGSNLLIKINETTFSMLLTIKKHNFSYTVKNKRSTLR
jgi:hypothetical protein